MSYPKSEGAAWPNDRKTAEKHPDYRGRIEVSDDQIRKLIQMRKAGVEPTLQIGIWSRNSKAGAPYLFISAEAYMKEGGQAQAQPQQPQPIQPPMPVQPVAPAADEFDDDIPF